MRNDFFSTVYTLQNTLCICTFIADEDVIMFQLRMHFLSEQLDLSIGSAGW